MFALQRAPLRAHTLGRAARAPHRARRHISVEAISNGLLDLALALPVPPSWPPYSTTIILVTIVSRAALVPFSIWSINRTRRQEEIVIPKMYEARDQISKRVLEQMRDQRITTQANKDKLQDIYNARASKAMQKHYTELLREYRCSPLATMFVPVATQIPVFMGITYLLNYTSAGATVFDSESFLSLSTLASPDPTMIFPIALGCLTLAQIESGNWMLDKAERDRQRDLELKLTDKPNGGTAFKSVLRGLSVVRVIVAALTPGSVQLYWVTSALWGLGQTWVFSWLNNRRRRRLLLQTDGSFASIQADLLKARQKQETMKMAMKGKQR